MCVLGVDAILHQVQTLFGGVDAREQKAKLKEEGGPHAIVACPGRLKQFVMDGTLDVTRIKMFVIDEVDKVLET